MAPHIDVPHVPCEARPLSKDLHTRIQPTDFEDQKSWKRNCPFNIECERHLIRLERRSPTIRTKEKLWNRLRRVIRSVGSETKVDPRFNVRVEQNAYWRDTLNSLRSTRLFEEVQLHGEANALRSGRCELPLQMGIGESRSAATNEPPSQSNQPVVQPNMTESSRIRTPCGESPRATLTVGSQVRRRALICEDLYFSGICQDASVSADPSETFVVARLRGLALIARPLPATVARQTRSSVGRGTPPKNNATPLS